MHGRRHSLSLGGGAKSRSPPRRPSGAGALGIGRRQSGCTVSTGLCLITSDPHSSFSNNKRVITGSRGMPASGRSRSSPSLESRLGTRLQGDRPFVAVVVQRTNSRAPGLSAHSIPEPVDSSLTRMAQAQDLCAELRSLQELLSGYPSSAGTSRGGAATLQAPLAPRSPPPPPPADGDSSSDDEVPVRRTKIPLQAQQHSNSQLLDLERQLTALRQKRAEDADRCKRLQEALEAAQRDGALVGSRLRAELMAKQEEVRERGGARWEGWRQAGTGCFPRPGVGLPSAWYPSVGSQGM